MADRSRDRLSSAGIVARCMLTYLACAIASGPLVAFPSFEPLLFEAGVFRENCLKENGANAIANNGKAACPEQNNAVEAIYPVSVGMSLGFFFLVGIFFDCFGPRVSGVFGASMVALCLTGVALSVLAVDSSAVPVTTSPSRTWLLFVALPLSDVFGLLCGFAMYGFIWHLPSCRNLVLGLGNSAYQVSGVTPLVLRKLIDAFELSLVGAMFILSGSSLVAAVVLYFVAPSQADFVAQGQKSNAVFTKAPGSGSTPEKTTPTENIPLVDNTAQNASTTAFSDRPPRQGGPFACFRKLRLPRKSDLKAFLALARDCFSHFRPHLGLHILFFSGILTTYMFSM